MTLIIIIALVAIVAIYILSTQRSLVNLDELAANAFKQISVQLTSRWDAVSALVAMTEKYSEHESKTLKEVIGARSKATTPAEVARQEGELNGILGRLMAVVERYPELKADALYKESMQSINQYENLVRTSRMVYNDSVTKFNRMVRQWPSSFVASMLHFSVKEYLEDQPAKADYPPISK